MSDVVSRREQTMPTRLADMPGDHWTEIFHHLPPQPHSLLRVSHVCRSWRRLAADPAFLRSFRARHNDTPPLVGVFHNTCYEGARRFTPTGTGAPLRGFSCPAHWHVLDSRHGRVLFHTDDTVARGGAPPVLILWDPVTRRCEQIEMPPDWAVYNYGKLSGAVVCRAGDDADGRHGDCRSSPFLVVLLIGREPRVLVSFYSSEAGGWNKALSFDGLPLWAEVVPKPCVVIRNTLYQPVSGSHSLAFELESRSFTIIPHPPETKWMDVLIVRVDGGKLGLVVANNLEFSLHLWVWEGAGNWVKRKMVQLDTLEPLSAVAQPGVVDLGAVKLIGACDYGNAIFLWTRLGSFMLQLDTKELKELPYDSTLTSGSLYPYESFFSPVQARAPTIRK